MVSGGALPVTVERDSRGRTVLTVGPADKRPPRWWLVLPWRWRRYRRAMAKWRDGCAWVHQHLPPGCSIGMSYRVDASGKLVDGTLLVERLDLHSVSIVPSAPDEMTTFAPDARLTMRRPTLPGPESIDESKKPARRKPTLPPNAIVREDEDPR